MTQIQNEKVANYKQRGEAGGAKLLVEKSNPVCASTPAHHSLLFRSKQAGKWHLTTICIGEDGAVSKYSALDINQDEE